MARQCNYCNQLIDDNDVFCPNCGANNPPVGAPPVSAPPTNPLTTQPDKPMKWFKFVIYVQLWLSALSCLGSAVQMFTGMHYNGEVDLVYSVFPGMQTADMIHGVISIALAVAAIVVRFQLAGYRKNAHNMYLGYLVATIAAPLLYTFLSANAMAPYDTSELWSEAIGSAVGSIVVMVLNSIYFKKREHLFVN